MLEILYNRRSTRKFSEKKVEDDIIHQLLKADCIATVQE